MSSISDLLDVVKFDSPASTIIPESRMAQIKAEFSWVQHVAAKQTGIYGLNTLVGHRDNEAVPLSGDSQHALISSHLVPSQDKFFGTFEARCITVAKAFAVRNGGTGLSASLADHLLTAIDSVAFDPKIPTNQSYSSGDVIPGAYWAKALLEWADYSKKNSLFPGEALALINGSFVHIGVSAAVVPSAISCNAVIMHAFAALACLSGRGAHDFERTTFAEKAFSLNDLESLRMIVAKYSSDMNGLLTRPQASVSIRAFPELIMVLNEKTLKFINEISYSLNSRSANPMYDYVKGTVSSTATFVLPTLSIDESSLIDCMLLVGTALVGGLQYVLSGRVRGIPIDAHRDCDPYGFIQIPKELMARLERLRLVCGRRLFSSGGSTSNEIEDLWSYGLNVTEQLQQVIIELQTISLRIINVCEIISQSFNHKKIFLTLDLDSSLTFIDILRNVELTRPDVLKGVNHFL